MWLFVELARALMLIKILDGAIASSSSQDARRVDSIREWYTGPVDTVLNSTTLLTIMPSSSSNPTKPFAWRRFRVWHMIELFINSQQPKEHPKVLDESYVVEDLPTNHMRLGEIYLFGILGIRDLKEAVSHFKKAADSGIPAAQFMLGLSYSTGLFGNFEQNQAKATLYYTIASIGGSIQAKMALASRAMYGIAGPVDYTKARDIYRNIAGIVKEYCEKMPGIGHLDSLEPHGSWSIADECDGGVYGAVTKKMANTSPLRQLLRNFDSDEDGIDYFKYRADDRDDLNRLQTLARIYSLSIGGETPKYLLSLGYVDRLVKIALQAPTSHSTRRYLSWAYLFLGDRYRLGEGLPFDVDKAIKCYLESQKYADTIKSSFGSHYGLGLIDMWFAEQIDKGEKQYKERGTQKALYAKALKHFQEAPKMIQSINHAVMLEYKLTGDIDAAYNRILSLYRHPTMEYFMGDLCNDKITPKSREILGDKTRESAQMYRDVVAAGEDILSPIRWALLRYVQDTDSSLIGFLVAAEQGVQAAQANLADILDSSHAQFGILKSWPVPDYVRKESRVHDALTYFIRASQQGSKEDMLLKVADYYYYGWGVPKDESRAANYYQILQRNTGSSMAAWNLGWMHEYGRGVTKDFHLAKRFYDHALVYSSDSYLAVKFSLIRLYAKNYWNWISGNRDHVIEQKPVKPLSREERTQLFAEVLDYSTVEDPVNPNTEPEEQELEVSELTIDIAMIFILLAAIVGWVFLRNRRRQLVNDAAGPQPVPPPAPVNI